MIIYFKSGESEGLYACLFRILEWMYCVRNDKKLKLYIDLNDYGYKDTFSSLFKPSQDPQIKIGKPDSSEEMLVVQDLPGFCFRNLKVYVADGLDTSFSEHFKYVYAKQKFYKIPSFQIFRERLHPYAWQFFQLESPLQNKVDDVMRKMTLPNTPNTHKIGIFIRSSIHFKGWNKSSNEFLNIVKRDIDQIMQSKDPKTTTIYLSTICEPVVQMLANSNYNVVWCSTPRLNDVTSDVTKLFPYSKDMTDGAIVDVWSLSKCDEIWGGASNIMLFAGCINPHLKINFLPCFENYDCH